MSQDSQSLKEQITKLGLHTIANLFESEAQRAAKSESTYTAYLARLVEAELADKADRSINARIHRAKFSLLRTLEEFDFGFQPGLSAARVRELANLSFIDQAANVLFIGGPGVGKTHLAIALALKACAARRSVLFTEGADLLDQLAAAEVSHTLGKVLDRLRRADLSPEYPGRFTRPLWDNGVTPRGKQNGDRTPESNRHYRYPRPTSHRRGSAGFQRGPYPQTG